MDGNLSVSFYIGGWNLWFSALPSCWWLMGLFTTSSFGLEGDTEWGFCQHSGRFGSVPEPRALQPKLCLHHRSPWAFLDFNHFQNRCISVRMDKVLKLALGSLKPKLCLVIKQCLFFASNKEIKWKMLFLSIWLLFPLLYFWPKLKRLLNCNLKLLVTPFWLNKRVKWKQICKIPANSLCTVSIYKLACCSLWERKTWERKMCVCAHAWIIMLYTSNMSLLFIIWQGPWCVT